MIKKRKKREWKNKNRRNWGKCEKREVSSRGIGKGDNTSILEGSTTTKKN